MVKEKILMPLCYDVKTKTFNANSIIISNVADPVEENDVVTLDYLKEHLKKNNSGVNNDANNEIKIKNLFDNIDVRIKELNKHLDTDSTTLFFTKKYEIIKSETGAFITDFTEGLKPFTEILDDDFVEYILSKIAINYTFKNDKDQIIDKSTISPDFKSEIVYNFDICEDKNVVQNKKTKEIFVINKKLTNLKPDSLFKVASSKPVNLLSCLDDKMEKDIKTISIKFGYLIKVVYFNN